MANVYLRGDDGWRERPSLERVRALARDLAALPGIDSVAIRGEEPESAELYAGGATGFVGMTANGLWQHGDAFASAFEAASPHAALASSLGDPHPDAAFALTSLFASERAGDLLVSAAVGVDLRTRREWPEHHASHGALHRSHTVVPVRSSAPLPDHPLRTIDLFAHALALAGIPLEDYAQSDAFLIERGVWRPGVAG
jgi:hypothetical protein